ncbi:MULTISPECIES: IlvD/Edd family dehydratase [Microbacterium]|uniref:IlvD/Edd family dehydratase n=1 Tax=Microbacterium TaxID=33882 RepID=UPI00146DBB5F|nr:MULTISPECIES: IlvD/Edd family dehydratase [Microbacterium]
MAEDDRLRSASWFAAEGRNGFIHRSWMRNQGFGPEVFDGRPVIGIANSASEFTPCNAHLSRVAEAVKRGVWEAGGFPVEFPTMSLGEALMRPTTMLYRNLLAMEIEASIRANPMDAVVLLAGCDKTTPAMVMGAASVDLPTLLITGGPMLNGKFRGRDIGSGTDVWRFSEEVRAGRMTADEFAEAEGGMSRSPGHCMTMGSASTMGLVTEALGLQLSGSAAIPAADSRRLASAQAAGRRIVAMVGENLRLSSILTRKAFENAVKMCAAIGGSTNAVVHLIAIANRVGVPLAIDDFDALTRDVPVIANLMPSGQYLMEDLFYAGGMPAVMNRLREHLHLEAITVSGRSIGEEIAPAESWNDDVIRTVAAPVSAAGNSTVVLRGSLAPDGAVLKVSAASASLLTHRGRAVVFDSIEDYNAVCDDPDLDVAADDILVVRGNGPVGYPGFPEVGNVQLPRKLLEQGVTDMVRVSDARMSGTGFGTCILHVSPEAAVGGPLAFVRSGDWIQLDVPARTIDLLVDDAELEQRRAAWVPAAQLATRGWEKLYVENVEQAHLGADLGFMRGSSGSVPPRHSH